MRKPLQLTRTARAEEKQRKNSAAKQKKTLKKANNLVANLRANVAVQNIYLYNQHKHYTYPGSSVLALVLAGGEYFCRHYKPRRQIV